MFGYIRPIPAELKIREFESFKACYCGLCHSLGKKYGFFARLILNYELVFLAMLLWDENEEPVIERKRCAASLCRKRKYCRQNAALSSCAGYSVILAWWKLKDEISDEHFIKTIPHRIASVFLYRAYKKAAKEFLEFDSTVRVNLKELSELESKKEATIDSLADKFALILKASVPDDLPEVTRRALSELLYHTGRWVYIIDAYDDLKADAAAGRFNPIAQKYGLGGVILPEGEALERLNTTLKHSNNLLCSAFELLPENAWSETVRNIIYLGMADICTRVLAGTWRRERRHNFDKDRI